jgi:hypothetical protein
MEEALRTRLCMGFLISRNNEEKRCVDGRTEGELKNQLSRTVTCSRELRLG